MSEKMIFCLGDGKYESKGEGYQKNLCIFNVDVSEQEYIDALSNLRNNNIKIALTHWCEEKNMTKEDRKSDSHYKELGGCLKVFSYGEAWKTFWDEASKQQKDTILGLPHFNSGIFKEITGIDVKVDDATEEAMKLLKSKGFKIIKE